MVDEFSVIAYNDHYHTKLLAHWIIEIHSVEHHYLRVGNIINCRNGSIMFT